MKIVRSLLTPKKNPTTKAENKKPDEIKIEKEFEVSFEDMTPKNMIKRISSRDINSIKTPTKKTSGRTAAKIEALDKAETTKSEAKKFENTKKEAMKAETAKVKRARNVRIVDSIAKTKPAAIATDTTKVTATVVKINKTAPKKTAPVERKKSERRTIVTQPVTARKSSRLSLPTKSVVIVTKSTRKIERKKCDADELFDESEAPEMEMIEISENDEMSEVENLSEIEEFSDEETTKKKRKTVKKKKKIITKQTRKKDASRWERIKKILESGGTVEALPGRVDEFDWIKRTVTGLLESSLGGCLYISGVPGTGKTATTHRTLDSLSLAALKGECRDFDFVEINGMRLSDPGQAYSILAKTIFREDKKKVPSSGALALQKLENHFKSQQKCKKPGRPCVVLLDELDLLLRKKQSILYHFFEWPNWANSQLIVITIANTMDLPERFLSNRISSRLGLTRYNFKPYDHAALANIIEHQLKDYVKYLGKDAIQLCARKVSAVSGDARRAVNLAKRAVDYFRSCSQEELLARMTGRIVEKVAEGTEMTVVNLRLMDIILKDALMANPVEVISQLAKHQRILLLSIVLARKRCEEETSLRGGTKIIGAAKSNAVLTINRVLEQHFQLCRTHQYHPLPSLQELYCLLETLESLRLLRCVKFRESGPEGVVQLLVHEEDIRKGLGDDQALKKYIRE